METEAIETTKATIEPVVPTDETPELPKLLQKYDLAEIKKFSARFQITLGTLLQSESWTFAMKKVLDDELFIAKLRVDLATANEKNIRLATTNLALVKRLRSKQ